MADTLSGARRILRSAPHADIALDAASFAGLDIPAAQVFITENETNFLLDGVE